MIPEMESVMRQPALAILMAALSVSACTHATQTAQTKPEGRLIFFDDFERQESQELVDEVGNGWTTASARTAQNNKQADLRDGALYIYRHATGNHSVSVRQEAGFSDGEIRMRFMFDSPNSNVKVNVADMDLKTVSAGHLLFVDVLPDQLHFQDHKFGKMQKAVTRRRRAGQETEEDRLLGERMAMKLPIELALNEWHDLSLIFKGERITAFINGEEAGSHASPGFAHPTKGLVRLLIKQSVYVDDVAFYAHD